MILSGAVKPGEYLASRQELAEQFGVGQSAIHEAIRVLNTMGLVESRAGKGTWVSRSSMQGLIPPEVVRQRLHDLDDAMLYDVRIVLEVALAEFAAERASAEDIAAIWEALSASEHAIVREDTEAYIRADLDFHLAVAKAAHNQLLQEFYQLSMRLLQQEIASIAVISGSKEGSILTQRAIARAIEKKDPAGARQAASDHLGQVGFRLLHRKGSENTPAQ